MTNFFKNNILKNRNFALFILGQATSVFGDVFLNIAFSLYVLKITGSSVAFASVLAIGVLPKIFLGPFTGTIVDWFNKKKSAIFLDLIRFLFLLFLIVLLFQKSLNLSYIYLAVIFFAICDMFFTPCFITLLPLILKEENLVAGNAMRNVIMEMAQIVAPVIATLLYGLYGVICFLIIDAATFLIAAVSSSFLQIKEEVNQQNKKNFVYDIVDGFKVIIKDIKLTSLVANGFVTHLFLFPFIMVGIPYLLINIFKVPDVYYGMVESSITIGSVTSVLLVGFTKEKYDIGRNINFGIFGMAICSVFYFCIGFKPFIQYSTIHKIFPLIYFCILHFLLFFAFKFYGVYFASYYQANVPKQYLGRFGAILIMLFSLGRFLGFKLFGYLFNNRTYLLAVTIFCIGTVLKIFIHIPFLRHSKSNEIV